MIKVTDKDFEKRVIKSKMPVLVDFWAPWCGPCHALNPTLQEIADAYGQKVLVCTINVEENKTIPTQFSIRSVPTLLLFKQGKNIGQLVGNVPKGVIEELLKATLK
ncbi:MAG: thioredoxin [Pseudomonadota bacterium]